MALRSRGECGRSWHLIWGASRLGRSSPQLAVFPYPGCVVGLCREEYVRFSTLVCPERGHYAADHSDITHKSSTTGQIKHSASQLELPGDSEREVAVSCWCVCKPCRNKATFSSTAVVQTSPLNKPPKAWVLWKFWQSNAYFLQGFTTPMEGVQFYWRRMKPGVLLRNIKRPM